MQSEMLHNSFVLSIVAVLNTFPNPMLADEGVSKTNNDGPIYRTPEWFRRAKPLPLPTPRRNIKPELPITTTTETPVSSDGKPPTVNVAPDMKNRLFIPNETVDSVNKKEIEPN